MGFVQSEAKRLGVEIVLNRNGAVTGLGMNMPTATDLIICIFKDRVSYRFLSAFAARTLLGVAGRLRISPGR